MTDCERLSDRMPEVAVQRSAWTAAEAAHLTSCAKCRAEWELVLAARRLERRAPIVDAAAIAAAVQGRLAAGRTARRRSRRAWVAGSAAAAAAAVAIALSSGSDREVRPQPTAVAQGEALVPLPELEGLETAQLDTLLRTLDGALTGTAPPDSSILGDEADAELDRIFATWEG